MRTRLAAARVAHLATAGAGGRPHIVPVTFALDGDTVYFAVDAKPKRTRDLKRLRNIAENAAVSLLVDHYDDDWDRLWWIRADGTASVLEDQEQADHALDLLAKKYPQYADSRPAGPVVSISIARLTAWP
jgi:PPOX class probable F420-dependent enzyme